MELNISDFVGNRLQELTDNMRKTDAEYALAVKRRRELCDVVNDIAVAKQDLVVNERMRKDFNEYLEHELTATAIEQETFYRQGYLDCVTLLQYLKVL